MTTTSVKPSAWLSSYHGVIALMGMLVMLICNGMVLSGLTPFRFAFAEKYQWQMQQMNFADLVTFGVVGILAPFLGALMDRIGVRKLMMLGGVMLIIGYFCYAQVTTLAGMYGVHVILGAAVALSGLVPASRLIGRWFELQRGTAMGITLAGSSIASFVFYPLAVKFIAADGLSLAFQKLAWGGMVLTFLAALLVRDRPEDMGLSTFGQSADRKVTNESQLPGVEFQDVLRSSSFWCLALGAASTFFAMLGALYNVPAHLVDLGFDRAGAGKGLQAMLTAALVGKFLFGLLSDLAKPKLVYIANLALMALGALFIAMAGKDHVLWALGFFGLGWGGLYTMLQLLAVESFGIRSAGRVLGTIAIFDAVGGGLGSYVMGIIRTQHGNYVPAFYLMFGLITLATIASFWIKRLRY